MPKRVLKAYSGFLEDMKVRFQLGGTLGAKHGDPTSIPQGCPFSMSLIALLLRPWIMVMRELGVSPRALADDLFFLSEGPGHGKKALWAMEKSREYFSDIGAKVAEKKCLMGSTCPQTRRFFRNSKWQKRGEGIYEEGPINVSNNFRDLGCHMCLDNTGAATTTSQRIYKAVASLKKLRWIPISKQEKNHH